MNYGRGIKKIPDEIVISTYEELQSVRKTAKKLGLSVSTIHKRLVSLEKSKLYDVGFKKNANCHTWKSHS